MITEDYVSFETAKLLKEKGFDIQSYASIKVFGGNTYEVNGEWINPTKDTIIPTLQMAMKWLREVHGLFIGIDYVNIAGLGFTYQATILRKGEDYSYCLHKKHYEEACEAAIKYCLENLI